MGEGVKGILIGNPFSLFFYPNWDLNLEPPITHPNPLPLEPGLKGKPIMEENAGNLLNEPICLFVILLELEKS